MSNENHHQALVKKAAEAIDDIFNDTGVDPLQTIKSLVLLQIGIQNRIDIIKEDNDI